MFQEKKGPSVIGGQESQPSKEKTAIEKLKGFFFKGGESTHAHANMAEDDAQKSINEAEREEILKNDTFSDEDSAKLAEIRERLAGGENEIAPASEDFLSDEEIVHNLSKRMHGLEGMGVTQERAQEAVKRIIIKNLKDANFGHGSIGESLSGSKLYELLDVVGDVDGEILKDREIRDVIIQEAIPKFCNYITSDGKNFERINGAIKDIVKTFGITRDELDASASYPAAGNAVRDYLGAKAKSL